MIKKAVEFHSIGGGAEEEFLLSVFWEGVLDLGYLQSLGRIKNLRYRKEKGTGGYIVHFMETELLNI